MGVDAVGGVVAGCFGHETEGRGKDLRVEVGGELDKAGLRAVFGVMPQTPMTRSVTPPQDQGQAQFSPTVDRRIIHARWRRHRSYIDPMACSISSHG